MSGPSTAPEALIAEAIGDMARLLDRADALQRAMTDSRQACVSAHAQLSQQLSAFEAQVHGITEEVKVRAVKHILVCTDEAARRSVDAQTRALSEAAQALFRSELEPAMRRLAAPLGILVQRLDRPWRGWLIQAATAAVGRPRPGRSLLGCGPGESGGTGAMRRAQRRPAALRR